MTEVAGKDERDIEARTVTAAPGPTGSEPTRALIHLDRLGRNMRLLQELVGKRRLWPAIKANAYGHGAEIVARYLVGLGYDTLCVARIAEALALRRAGIRAVVVILSATRPEESDVLVANGFEPVVCTTEMAEALGRSAGTLGKQVAMHLKIDTGMGRIGMRPEEAVSFLERCRACEFLRVRGLMSHFARADEADKAYSNAQIERFLGVVEATGVYGIEIRHMANSAAIFDLPSAHFDAARPGIAIYGLAPSATIANPRVRELEPVLEWKTCITFLKEVPAGTGLSYGHAFHTKRRSLFATVPVGYGDGLDRRLSNSMEMLVGGVRCPQVGRITMDQSLVDVTRLRGKIACGDEVVLIGRQGYERIDAGELAERSGTINYEIVTGIAERVPRIAIFDE